MSNKVMYGARLNLSGLWSKKPVKLFLDPDFEYEYYWDKNGDFGINPIELQTDGYVDFISSNKKEVQIWIDGILATKHIINRIFG